MAAFARELGYTQVLSQTAHGQKVFSNGKDVISFDVDGHNGGFWKLANDFKALLSRKTRRGTFDPFLRRRVGD